MTLPPVVVALAAGTLLAWAVAGPLRPARRPCGASASVPARARRQGPAVAPRSTAPPWTLAAMVLALLVAGPVAALVVGAGPKVVAALRRHRHRQRHRSEVIDELPDVVDLLRLGVGAGLAMPQAIPLVAGRAASPVRAALRSAHGTARAGRPLGDSLELALRPLGDGATGLAHVLADHLRYGTPAEPELRRLGLEVRTERRHRAEQAARRVPVRLLLPLVTCVLPAFALLTVVPLLAGSLQGVLV